MNQRIESIRSEKERLRQRLSGLVLRVPPGMRDGSVNVVREWKQLRGNAQTILQSSRSSVNDLSACLADMEKFE